MPSINRQISGSSSTIRMSYAIRHLHRQNERGHRSRAVVPVLERQPAAMVLHDLLHDGEAKTGTLGLMRHIGFGQSRTILIGQSDPVIGHDDANIIGIGLHGEADRSAMIASPDL